MRRGWISLTNDTGGGRAPWSPAPRACTPYEGRLREDANDGVGAHSLRPSPATAHRSSDTVRGSRRTYARAGPSNASAPRIHRSWLRNAWPWTDNIAPLRLSADAAHWALTLRDSRWAGRVGAAPHTRPLSVSARAYSARCKDLRRAIKVHVLGGPCRNRTCDHLIKSQISL